MSAISVLKNKSVPALDANANEFAALEGLDPDARPVKSRSRRKDIEVQLQLNNVQQGGSETARWIRDNIKVTQTRKGRRVSWTPWKNGSDLAMIRDWFYPHHAAKDPYSAPTGDLRKEAINVVREWEVQNRDLELPHSIIATARLSDAMLHDTKPTKQRLQHITDQALQSIYAMAFCLFVNGFVDRDVAKSSLIVMATTTATDDDGLPTSTFRGESSMYALAIKISMPLRFVEMRHQITHEKMPSIEELAEIAEEALEWMYERWWKAHASFDPAAAWSLWLDEKTWTLVEGSQEHDKKNAQLSEDS